MRAFLDKVQNTDFCGLETDVKGMHVLYDRNGLASYVWKK